MELSYLAGSGCWHTDRLYQFLTNSHGDAGASRDDPGSTARNSARLAYNVAPDPGCGAKGVPPETTTAVALIDEAGLIMTSSKSFAGRATAV
jgi:hypothetical protein